MLSIIGNALGLGLKIMDKIDKNSDKASFEEFKSRKKEMDNSLADADVEGIDSAYKITLLASLCYGLKINHNYSSFCGIKNFNKEDIKYSKKLGFRIKLISEACFIEEKIFIKIENQLVKAIPEEDVDRTSLDGKASSVQFIHFKLNDEQIQKFKSEDVVVEIGIDHKEYSHMTKLSTANIISLLADLN